MTNTIRNVIMLVNVLMMSSQVSENLKIGPVTAQVTTMSIARINDTGLAVALETQFENLVNTEKKFRGGGFSASIILAAVSTFEMVLFMILNKKRYFKSRSPKKSHG
jgi:hypothetical protein